MLEIFEKASADLQDAIEKLTVEGLGEASSQELRAAAKLSELASEFIEAHEDELLSRDDAEEELPDDSDES